MNEQEPNQEEVEYEALQQGTKKLIELIETKESFSGHLDEQEKADLIGGLRELGLLENRDEEHPNPTEFILNEQDTIGEIYGLLEQYGVSAEEAMLEAGLLE